MRITKENAKKLTTKKKVRPIDRFPKNAKAPMEKRIAELEGRLDLIEDRLVGAAIFARSDMEEPKSKKPGAHPKITDEGLFHYRLQLVLWLERVWPELVPELLRAKNIRNAEYKQHVVAALERFANKVDIRQNYESRLLQNTEALLEFVRSDRFSKIPPKQTVTKALIGDDGDEATWRAASRFPPRQIANAMAGVPEIDWRTSLDRCSKQPLQRHVGIATSEYYRKFYGLPAYYIIDVKAIDTVRSGAVGGPCYTKQQAKTVLRNQEIEGKRVILLSDAELQKLQNELEQIFKAVPGMEEPTKQLL